jgi:hypothetical protein
MLGRDGVDVLPHGVVHRAIVVHDPDGHQFEHARLVGLDTTTGGLVQHDFDLAYTRLS